MASVRIKTVKHPSLERLRYVRRSVDNKEPTYSVLDVMSGEQKNISSKGVIAENTKTGEKTWLTIEEAKEMFKGE